MGGTETNLAMVEQLSSDLESQGAEDLFSKHYAESAKGLIGRGSGKFFKLTLAKYCISIASLISLFLFLVGTGSYAHAGATVGRVLAEQALPANAIPGMVLAMLERNGVLVYFYMDEDEIAKYQIVPSSDHARHLSQNDGVSVSGPHLLDESKKRTRILPIAVDDEEALMEQARRGNVDAQFSYGVVQLKKGRMDSAELWLSKAAEQGHARAMNNLGYMFFLGNDQFLAYYWFLKSALNHSELGMYNMGHLLRIGWTRLGDEREGFQWMLKAAKKGVARAQYELGEMYAMGEGVSPNSENARKWCELAAHQDYPDAQNQLGLMYKSGYGGKQSAYLASEWLLKSAAQGNVDADYNLGNVYYYGEIVDKDRKKAAMYYKRAAENGHAHAQSKLAFMYENGDGVEQSDRMADYWKRQRSAQPSGVPESGAWADYGTSAYPYRSNGLRGNVNVNVNPPRAKSAAGVAGGGLFGLSGLGALARVCAKADNESAQSDPSAPESANGEEQEGLSSPESPVTGAEG